MNKKKLLILLFAAMMTVSSAACNSVNVNVELVTATPAPTTTQVPTATLVPTATMEPTATSVPTATPTPTSTPTPAITYPPQVSLSGNPEDHLITKELCYIEGDKFFLLVSEDADLPGDLAEKVALIIDEIENVTGLSFTVDRPIDRADASTVTYGYNPWEDFPFGQKVPIYIKVDHDSVGYISCACAEFAIIYDNDIICKDVWNSVPAYRDNPWRLSGSVNYYAIAHELTHVLTERYASLTKIITEGGADYVAEKVIKSLASTHSGFEKNLEIMSYNLFYSVNNEVTPENAEEVFRDDYRDLAPIDRGDEYILGRMICQFLYGTYGDTFFSDYLAAAQKAGYGYGAFCGDLEDADINKLTDIFKELFGEDVFKGFGEYYLVHKND